MTLKIETPLSAEQLRPMLEAWQPWRMDVEFSNGLRTRDFERIEPFAPNPLGKLQHVERRLDLAQLRGGRALDIGFNIGYNSLYLASEYDMDVVGIEVSPKNMEIATFLRESSSVADRVRFELGDAETFRDGEFDLVVHMGTLYHLPNPLLALETTAQNLRPGGRLILETQIFIGEDQSLTKFINGFRGDTTNWWALSRETLLRALELYGFEDVETVLDVQPEVCGPDMGRILLIAKRSR